MSHNGEATGSSHPPLPAPPPLQVSSPVLLPNVIPAAPPQIAPFASAPQFPTSSGSAQPIIPVPLPEFAAPLPALLNPLTPTQSSASSSSAGPERTDPSSSRSSPMARGRSTTRKQNKGTKKKKQHPDVLSKDDISGIANVRGTLVSFPPSISTIDSISDVTLSA